MVYCTNCSTKCPSVRGTINPQFTAHQTKQKIYRYRFDPGGGEKAGTDHNRLGHSSAQVQE